MTAPTTLPKGTTVRLPDGLNGRKGHRGAILTGTVLGPSAFAGHVIVTVHANDKEITMPISHLVVL